MVSHLFIFRAYHFFGLHFIICFLHSQVLVALSQLEFGSDVWERVLLQAFRLLTDSKDEPLAASISFVFKAATQCQRLSQAVYFSSLNYIFFPGSNTFER